MSENIAETKPITTVKAALNYGIIFGVILIIMFVIGYAFDIDPRANGTAATVNFLLNIVILPFVFIFLACNHFKKASNGYITFGQALKTGVAVAVIAATIAGVFNVIFSFIDPEIQVKMIEKGKEDMVKQNPNMSSEQLKTGIEFIEFMTKPYIVFALGLIWYALVGLIQSLIVGAIVKKENPGAF